MQTSLMDAFHLILEVLWLDVDAVGADDADGAVHLRLAEGRREAARLHQEVHHVHLKRERARFARNNR